MVKIIGCDLHWASLMHKKKVICKKAQEHSHFMWEKIVHFSLSLSLVFATGQLLYVMICIHYGFASKLPVKRLQLQKAMAFIEHGNRLLSKSMAVFFFLPMGWREEEKKGAEQMKFNLCVSFLLLPLIRFSKSAIQICTQLWRYIALWPCSVSIHCIHMSHTIESLVCRWFKQKTNWYTFFSSHADNDI